MKFLPFILLLVYYNCHAQTEGWRHKNIIAEYGGASYLAGLSYDVRLQKEKLDGIGIRFGMAVATEAYNDKAINIYTLPIQINYIIGKKRIGFITGMGLNTSYIKLLDQPISDFSPFIVARKNGWQSGVAYLELGFRLQPISKGIYTNISWLPLLIPNKDSKIAWISLGLGYGFKNWKEDFKFSKN